MEDWVYKNQTEMPHSKTMATDKGTFQWFSQQIQHNQTESENGSKLKRLQKRKHPDWARTQLQNKAPVYHSQDPGFHPKN